mgnify:CR=1 FL=1
MTHMSLTNTQMRSGIWQGIISGSPEEPILAVTHLDKPVPDVTLVEAKEPGDWVLQIPVPQRAISDGVQTIVITDLTSTIKLGSFTMIAGEALGEDLRAEVDLLRAELDMLKRAFRKHCLETK